jgi:hypothetical protein
MGDFTVLGRGLHVAGGGNELIVVNSTSDVVTVGSSHGTDTVEGLAELQRSEQCGGSDAHDMLQDTLTTTSHTISSAAVSYTLPTNVNDLLFTLFTGTRIW